MTKINKDVFYFNEWAMEKDNSEIRPSNENGLVLEIKGIVYLISGDDNNVAALKIDNNTLKDSFDSFKIFSTVLKLIGVNYFTLYTKKGRWDWIKREYPDNVFDNTKDEDREKNRERLIIETKAIMPITVIELLDDLFLTN